MTDERPSSKLSKASGRDLSEGSSSAENIAAEALEKAAHVLQTISTETGTRGDSQRVKLPDFAAAEHGGAIPASLGMLDDVSLRVKVELGRTQMYVEDVLRLNANSVVELDKAAGDPVDIYVNNRHIARGEVLVLNESFCVRVSEIIQQYESEG